MPGAGKTLAGLNIANTRHKFKDEEHAVFLSGNGPLVKVLQEALARDQAAREGISKKAAYTKTRAFIQNIHHFRDDQIGHESPPIEKVAIFDEAQRAWDMAQTESFMRQKKGISDFRQSEPEILISAMDRHDDWAVIVCLIGGGQEINTGEAGLGEWFEALRNKFSNWDAYMYDKLKDSEYIGDNTLNEFVQGINYKVSTSLHLAVSIRSFRSEKLAAFVKALLDAETEQAKLLYKELAAKYPIVMTRDLETAKQWVKDMSRGTERYGMIASSKAKRLRADGVWATGVQPEEWF